MEEKLISQVGENNIPSSRDSSIREGGRGKG